MKCEFPAKKRGAEQPAKGAKGEASSCKGEEDVDDDVDPGGDHQYEHNHDKSV